MTFKLVMPSEFFIGDRTIENLKYRLRENHYNKIIFIVSEEEQQYKTGLKIIRKIKTKDYDVFKYEKKFSIQKNIEQLIEVMYAKKYDMAISIGTKIVHDITRLAGGAVINNISFIFDHNATFEFKKNMPFTCISLEKYTLNAISSTIIIEGERNYFFNSKSFIPKYLIFDKKYANVFDLIEYRKNIGYLLYAGLMMISDPKVNLICATLATSGINTLLADAKKPLDKPNYQDKGNELIYASYSILSALNNVRMTHDKTIYTPLMLLSRYLCVNKNIDFYNFIIENNRYFFVEMEENKWDFSPILYVLGSFTKLDITNKAKELFDICESLQTSAILSKEDYKMLQKLKNECVQDTKINKIEKWINNKGAK